MTDQAEAQAALDAVRFLAAAPSPVELKLVDKHCNWIAFLHAWNAIMKRRMENLDTRLKALEGK